jgi:hypothetical protein
LLIRGEAVTMLHKLAQMLPVKTQDLEAKLRGIAGYTGWGEIEFSFWRSGRATFEVELHGVAGLKAQVFLNNEFLVEANLKDGHFDKTFDTRNLGVELHAAAGDIISVRQNGDEILSGVLALD